MTRTEKALDIAKFEGWTASTSIHTPQIMISKDHEFYNIDYLESFNGLMEIVEKVNKLFVYEGQGYHFSISPHFVTVGYGVRDEKLIEIDDSLIDALQNAIIFYLKEIRK